MQTDFERFRLHNLDCADCAARLEEGLKKLPGVNFASVNFATGMLVVDAKDRRTALEYIKREEPEVEIEKLGSGEGQRRNLPLGKTISLAAAIVLFIFGLTQVTAWHTNGTEVWEYLVFGTAYLLSGWGVLATAGRRLIHRKWFDESFLMSIATIGAIAIHELPEAVGVMLFYKLGELIQDHSLEGARDSIRYLMAIRADKAQVLEAGQVKEMPPEEVAVGARIVVAPGERVPLDGVVLEGESQVNRAALTGESVPQAANPGDEVHAGEVNLHARLVVEVSKRYEDSAAARLLALVEQAGSRKARTEQFITRFANYYTPVVVGLAGLIAFVPPLVLPEASVGEWMYRALVLLVIACPCALMTSIPLGYFGGIGGASRRGILVKGANYLDVLAQVRTVIFDKTGTLTRGRFAVREVVPREGYDVQTLMRIANEVERGSNHPIATSIRLANHHREQNQKALVFEERPGMGVRAEFDGYTALVGNDAMMHAYGVDHDECEPGGTALHVAVDNRYAGYVRLADEAKADAKAAIAALHTAGINRVMMLTGDREEIASSLASELGVDEFHAELLPEGKVRILEQQLEREGKGKVAYVGDGINDAPVLRRADVGIAMGDLGSHAAIESADVVLMTGSPMKVAEAIQHAKRTRRIVRQNIGLALGVKLLFIGLGIGAAAGMWEAVFADVGVTILAIINATRVLR